MILQPSKEPKAIYPRGRLSSFTLGDFLAFHRLMQGYPAQPVRDALGTDTLSHETGRYSVRLYTLFDYLDFYSVDFADWAQFERIHEPSHTHSNLWAEEVNEKLKTLGDNPYPRGYPRTLETWAGFVLTNKYNSGMNITELSENTGLSRFYFDGCHLKKGINFSVTTFLRILDAMGMTVFDWITWKMPKENPLDKLKTKRPKDKTPRKKRYTSGRRVPESHPWRRANEAHYRKTQQGTQRVS